MKTTVDILLATFNGKKYLKEQLDSIVAQSFNGWRIIARDDKSIDGSKALLEEYQKQFPENFKIIEDDLGNVGILKNFSLLMQHSTAPYIMFCDQDDLWLPDKILLTLEAMQASERNSPPEMPLLMHTDLKVVDEHLNISAHSFWQYQNLNPQLDALNRLLLQNTVTGCTMMINRRLLDMALPIPEQVIMHDWWMALIATVFGKIIILDQATILYRQHAYNDTGAKHWSLRFILKKALSFFKRDSLLKSIKLTQQQAEVFGKRFNELFSDEQKQMIDNYAKLYKKNYFTKRTFLYKHKLFKQGIVRNIGLFSII